MAAAQDPSPIAGLLAFRGRVPTFSDALVILEACRQGSLTMVNRRLTDLERREIACGDVFVFDEAVSGIKRWADGRLWSSSRMRDCFLIYVELGMAAGISGFNPRRVPASSPSELLRKKVLSITTSTGQRLRLVAYSSAMDDDSDEPAPDSNIQGITPRRDPRLANIVIPAGIFHSNTGPMGGARGDAEQQQQQQQQQSRVANAAQVSPSGSSASITGRSRGRPSAAIAAAAAAAAVGRSRSAASTVSNAHHQHHHAHGGHNYDSPYYGGIGHCNPSSSGSPPSSTMSAPAPDQHASNGPRRYHDQHLRRSADATSPAGSGCSAWTSTPTSAGSDVARYRAPYTGVGAYADMTTGYLPQHHHAYPPQHSYQHAYHGSAAAHAPPQQHSPAGYYDSAYDRYRPLSAHPPPQRASAAAGDPPVATVPAASTTPASRHSDPLTSLSSSTAGPPAAPVLTPNAYAADTLHHGTCPTYPHPHHYYPRYSGAIVPRFHPHHHHPAAPYYGGPAAPAPPPSSGQSYLPHSAPAPAPDPAAVTNGSTSHAPAPSPPSMGTRTSPPKTDPGMSSARSLDMSERTKDMPRVHRADSGMYLARDHRDRPGAWSGAHMYYPPVGFGFGIAGTNGDASASDRMGDAGRQDASPLGRVSDRDETGGRLSPTSVAVAGEAAGRSAGVV